jgi:hypothetical protein
MVSCRSKPSNPPPSTNTFHASRVISILIFPAAAAQRLIGVVHESLADLIVA